MTFMTRSVFSDDTEEIDGPFETIEHARLATSAHAKRYREGIKVYDAMRESYGLVPQFPDLVRTDILKAEFQAVEAAWH